MGWFDDAFKQVTETVVNTVNSANEYLPQEEFRSQNSGVRINQSGIQTRD